MIVKIPPPFLLQLKVRVMHVIGGYLAWISFPPLANTDRLLCIAVDIKK